MKQLTQELIKRKGNFLITGIDTDCGKTVFTAHLAKSLLAENQSVSTFKMVQTGCENFSDDILLHRKICGISLTKEDKEGLSCPYLFKTPCSPHLAAQIENCVIDPAHISKTISKMNSVYETLLIEGAGGLMVPLRENYTIIDFAKEFNLPVLLVTSGKLGSINHTLLSLEALDRRGIELIAIVYNEIPKVRGEIASETKRIFSGMAEKMGALFVTLEESLVVR